MPTTPPGPQNSAHFDGQQTASIIGVAGTLGTSDLAGTSPTVPIGVNPLTGALYTEPTTAGVGTIGIGTVVGNGASGVADSGNPVKVGGKYNSASPTFSDGQRGDLQLDVNGLLRVNPGALSQTTDSVNVGTISAGTITTGSLSNVAMLNAGTIVMASGTVTLLSTVTTVSNLTNGSVNILTGTLQSSGTTTGVGVVSNLTNGSVNVLTGTQQLLTTVSNLTNGSVNILTGTLQSSGTTTGVGVVTNLTGGTIFLGTVVGNIANAVAASGNPIQIAGVDATSGGTVRYIAVDTGGQQKLASSGTLLNLAAGTVLNTGTNVNMVTGTQQLVTTVSNLTNGSINILTGTLLNTGTNVNVVTGTILSSGTTTQLIPGTTATTLGKSGSQQTWASGDVGVALYGIKNDAFTTVAASTGQYAPINVDGFGRVLTFSYVNGFDSTGSVITAKPVPMAGTDAGGSLRIPLVDTNGVQRAIIAYPSGTYISAAGTTTVKSGAGVIHAINVGSLLGAGTLYNSAGTSTGILWAVTTPAPQTFTFDLTFGSLTWAGTGAQNISITYS